MELFHTHVSDDARVLVQDVLASGKLSEGEMVRRFEQGLADELGLANPVAVNSGTSALQLALQLAGVGPGDRVILPAITFVATGTAILSRGAVPVFADVDPETGNIDLDDAWKRCNGSVKAVVMVHWTGLPCDMETISGMNAVWDDLYFIEDAAHALGATCKGFPIGSSHHGSMAVFSLQSTKHLTTGDGGLLCSWNKRWTDKARKLRWFGIDRTLPVGETGERDFDIIEAGHKYHMNDVAAAIGLGNLEGFKQRLHRRQNIGSLYRIQLRNTPGVKLLSLPPDRTHAYYTFCMRVERRLDFCRAMKPRGVPVSVIARRIDRLSCFGGKRDDLPGTDLFDAEQVSVPCHEALSNEDVETVIAAVRKGW